MSVWEYRYDRLIDCSEGEVEAVLDKAAGFGWIAVSIAETPETAERYRCTSILFKRLTCEQPPGSHVEALI